MTLHDVVKRAQDRWDSEKRIKLPDVELISEDRLYTPPKGDRAGDNWNIQHDEMAG